MSHNIVFRRYRGNVPQYKTQGVRTKLNGEKLIVIACLGEKRTGGHDIRVNRLVAEGDSVKVQCLVEAPAEDSFAIQVLTYPADAVLIDKRFADRDFNLQFESGV